MSTDRASIQQVVQHAQTLTDAIAALPEGIPTPTHVNVYTYAGCDHVEIEWLLFGGSTAKDLDAQKAIAADVIHLMGGKWEKAPGELFGFSQERGAVHYNVTVNREAVCARVVVGTEEVVRLVPDPDALMVEVTETLETVEWRCEPLLSEAAS